MRTFFSANLLIAAICLIPHSVPALGSQDSSEAGKPALKLSLDLTYEETSKDSSIRRTTLEIAQSTVRYVYSHSGFPDKKNKKAEYRLTQNKIDKLIAFIRKRELNRDIDEVQTADGFGIAVNLLLVVELNEDTTAARIVGRKNIWDSDGTKQTNLTNGDFCEDVESLLGFLNTAFGFDI